MFRVAIDTGGTFTDIVAVNEAGQSLMVKALTDRRDPAHGIIQGLEEMASQWGMGLAAFLAETTQIVHGTTLALNALLEEKGAPTALLTTEGFRDALEIRRSRRDNQWDLRAPVPAVLVPRRHRIGVRERLDYKGEVVTPLDREQVRRVALRLKEWGIRSVAISFLFSFRDKRHEAEAADELRKTCPELYVTPSAEVAPRLGEFERTSTTVLNAYLTPVLSDYLSCLEEQLAGFGWTQPIDLILNSGGITDSLQAKNAAVKTLMSGPAGGAKGCQSLAQKLGKGNLVLADMGGTSFDVTLVVDGECRLTTTKEIEGHPLTLPMIDIHSIGAGGGSIASVDESGRLSVGPESAGANPGPACYGLGGTKPTVTDAALLLGLLNNLNFLDGKLPLDIEKAGKAVDKYVAKPLGLNVEDAALAIFQIAAAKMADAVRLLTVQEGLDPRGFALVAAGGAFPVFAANIAKELGMNEVILPMQAPVFCAWGMLGATCQQDLVRSCLMPKTNWNREELLALLAEMRQEGAVELNRQNLKEEQWVEEIALEMKYLDQHHVISISLAGECTEEQVLTTIDDSFHQRHLELYGYSEPEKPWEIVNMRLTLREKPREVFMPTTSRNAKAECIGTRDIRINSGEKQRARVFKGNSITPQVLGPALIDFPYTTIAVPRGFRAIASEGYISILREVGEE